MIVHRLADPDSVSREYSSLDRLLMRRLDRTGWLRFDELDEEQTLLAAVAAVRPRRVLDVGCGDGRIPSLYAAQEVVCVDTSPAAVAAARERGLDAWEADARKLPFADGSFDAVTCNHTLYHLADPDRALAELARVLRPGGRFAGIYNAPCADLQAYLDAFRELLGPLEAPAGPYPFVATRAKCVFVAEAP